jgi:hypothetical protein
MPFNKLTAIKKRDVAYLGTSNRKSMKFKKAYRPIRWTYNTFAKQLFPYLHSKNLAS